MRTKLPRWPQFDIREATPLGWAICANSRNFTIIPLWPNCNLFLQIVIIKYVLEHNQDRVSISQINVEDNHEKTSNFDIHNAGWGYASA